jgi:XTP/dITP diphosphohydrolase
MKRSLTWIIATRNTHKVGEIQAILGPAFEYRTLRDFPGMPAVREDAPDFAGNAVKKATEIAQFVAQHAEKLAGDGEPWVMADDSGLEVDALNGAPGVHSARFAATDTTSGNSPDAANNEKLLKLLRDVPMERRTARFRCVIAVTPVLFELAEGTVCYASEKELRTELFEGKCEGRIAFEPSGGGGFGYDPLFVPNGFRESFAELGEAIKNGLSHRAKALEQLRAWVERVKS